MDFKNCGNICLAVVLYVCFKVAVRLGIKRTYFEEKYDRFAIKNLRSNHLNRLRLHTHSCNKIRALVPNFLRATGDFELEIMNEFVSSEISYCNLERMHFIFIGDSHAEFLSRVRASRDDIMYAHSHSIWLGSTTLLGVGMTPPKDYVLSALKNIDISLNCKKIHIIWSFGSIDIRASLYELMVRRVVGNDNDIAELILKSLDIINGALIEDTQSYLDTRYPSMEVVNCFAAASNSFFEGETPKTTKEIRFLRKTQAFPTFGSIETRKGFTKVVNSTIRAWCDRNQYVYHDPYFDATKEDNRIYMRDGIHLTDPKVISNNVNEIILKGRVSYV
jgi:hypothetical protein